MAQIHVVGLGPGDLSGVPMGTIQLFKSGLPIFLRTKMHPAVDGLILEGIQFQTFDSIYESEATFSRVYEQIADDLLREAMIKGDIIYAVPGHPLIAEQSVQNLIAIAKSMEGVSVHIGSGQSFLDPVCRAVSLDPIGGFVLLDGTDLSEDKLAPKMHTLIAQVYDRQIASEVKLTLMSVYPDEYSVTVIRAAGVEGLEKIEEIPLYELDRITWIDHLTTLYVPKASEQSVLAREPWYVAGLVEQLRGPNGCPWDKEQTYETLRPYVIEEAYEVVDAIDEEDMDGLVSELGDLYLQVLLHAQIASETGDFSLRDVYSSLAHKLIRRHPHVFGDKLARSADEAEASWRAAKAKEISDVDKKSILGSIKKGRPALWRAVEVQKRVAEVGFDWNNPEQVLEKVKEEMNELEAEFKAGGRDRVIEEFGDLLFAAVNFSRWIDIDPEFVLSAATRKFEQRFAYVEQCVQESGNEWLSFSLDQLNLMWNEAKMRDNHKK